MKIMDGQTNKESQRRYSVIVKKLETDIHFDMYGNIHKTKLYKAMILECQ